MEGEGYSFTWKHIAVNISNNKWNPKSLLVNIKLFEANIKAEIFESNPIETILPLSYGRANVFFKELSKLNSKNWPKDRFRLNLEHYFADVIPLKEVQFTHPINVLYSTNIKCLNEFPNYFQTFIYWVFHMWMYFYFQLYI